MILMLTDQVAEVLASMDGKLHRLQQSRDGTDGGSGSFYQGYINEAHELIMRLRHIGLWIGPLHATEEMAEVGGKYVGIDNAQAAAVFGLMRRVFRGDREGEMASGPVADADGMHDSADKPADDRGNG